MNPPNADSFRTRLLILASLAVLGLLAIFLVQQYFQRLDDRLQQTRYLVKTLQTDMLMLPSMTDRMGNSAKAAEQARDVTREGNRIDQNTIARLAGVSQQLREGIARFRL